MFFKKYRFEFGGVVDGWPKRVAGCYLWGKNGWGVSRFHPSFMVRLQVRREEKTHGVFSGIFKLPNWEGTKQCKSMVNFEGFLLSSALFGLVFSMAVVFGEALEVESRLYCFFGFEWYESVTYLANG